MLYEVIPTQIFRKNTNFLTYYSDKNLKPGHIVIIPLGKKTIVGIVKKKTEEKIVFKPKPIEKLLYETPLPNHLLKSIIWLSKYYCVSMPAVASLVLPQGITKKRREKTKIPPKLTQKLPIIPLNPAQKQALKALRNAKEATKLLHGVTGSGKTNIYLKMTSECLNQGKSTILLVPEIALTSQLIQIFESAFGTTVTTVHSRQTESERHQIWQKILNSNDPQIIIGPRSALFAPLNNLGLIIIDEAHESTYYQENSPKYSSLRLASFIAKTLNISCIQGTATPLISDYYLAKKMDSLVTLSEKAKKEAFMPDIQIIDLREKQNFTKNRYFSNLLIETISKNLKDGHQTLIFHNRRGSAPLTLCENCGWQALCPSCFLPLTLHSDSLSLVCHSCGYKTDIPHSCPDCHTPNILHKGFGTKLLESELKKLFKGTKIARFDADNKKQESLDSLYNEVKSGDIDIIIGTQTIAKGLDLPKLASVGVVQADSGLSLPDFSAEEKTFHLLNQVIGRVGRGHLDTASVIIQSFQPENPVIKFAINSNYIGFYEYLINKREKQGFPPLFFLAKITITMKTESTVIKKIRELHKFLASSTGDSIKISAPAPAFHEHTVSGYTWQIILKSKSRTTLQKTLEKIDPKFPVHITLDPPSLI